MIRTGFVLSTTTGWTGGANYIRNLLKAIGDSPDRRIEPVLIVPPDAEERTRAEFPGFEVLPTRLVGNSRARRSVRRLVERVTGRDSLMEGFLRRHRVAVLSHSGHLGRRARIPAIVWLADMQHVRMPHFFSRQEIKLRDRAFRRGGRAAALIVVSSEDARCDLIRFMPDVADRTRVLRFVSGIASGPEDDDANYIKDEYGIGEPYFYLPNQFWQHKNHRLVVDALVLFKETGVPPLVVSTGATKDYRAEGHFDSLMAYRDAAGVADFFRVLGLVPYPDLGRLMRRSMAVINPSLFEGWSTTVEEAKALGKTVILSDIAVHREQNPDRAHFVDPANAVSLADAMRNVMAHWSPDSDREAAARAQRALTGRWRDFANTYQSIVEEALQLSERTEI